MNTNPLWTYSLLFYARPGVAGALLELQDGAGADVNLVIFLLWCAATGRRLDAARIAATDDALAAWRAGVIVPLRGVRRALKQDLLPGAATETLRSHVKAVELDAERLAQERLFALAPAPDGHRPDAASAPFYLSAYAERLGQVLPEAPCRVLLECATGDF